MSALGRASSSFRLDLILGSLLLLQWAGASWGLIIVGKGNDPVSDHNWPAGSLDVRPGDTGDGVGLSVRIQPAEGPGVGKWSGSTSVGAGGEFEFDNVPPGAYLIGSDLEAARAGRNPNAKRIRLEAGKTVEVELLKE